MPHSSGGGSHGGGFHGGGSHGGSSGNRISNHYFTGARRYVRHHRRTGQDEYVYATKKPQKANLFSIIIIVAIGVIFLIGIGAGTRPQLPKPLNGPFYGEPAVHDDADILGNTDALKNTITDYYGLTGICPVIYSVYDEMWQNNYADLESYTYSTYVDNFTDEQHFVIVYSIPQDQAPLVKEGKLSVPDYSWEAVQGDDTDLILTEGMFRRFGNLVQKDLESGADPGTAFDNAFKFAIKDAESNLKPFSLSRVIATIRSLVPLLLVGGFIVMMLILSIRQYLKDRDVEYEEVPLDSSDTSYYSGTSGWSDAGYAQSSGYSSAWTKGAKTASIAGVIFGIVFATPFVLSGLGMIIGGIFTLANADKSAGAFMLVFGIMWTLISTFILVSMIITFFKVKAANSKEDPLSAEYPQAEYPHAEYPKADYPDINSDDPAAAFVPSEDQPNPFVPLKDQQSPFVPSADNEEFDQRFFEPAKSNIEDDDDDYKRMKRRGFE